MTPSELSKTPRTDAAEFVRDEDCSIPDDMVVTADFSRTLERELNAANAELEGLRKERDEWKTFAGQAIHQNATNFPIGLHPQTKLLVMRFAVALAEKLHAAEKKYGVADDWRNDDWEARCREKLFEHVHKGDARDVAAFCAFAWHHGWSTTPKQPVEIDQVRAKLAELGEYLWPNQTGLPNEYRNPTIAVAARERLLRDQLTALQSVNAELAEALEGMKKHYAGQLDNEGNYPSDLLDKVFALSKYRATGGQKD